MELNKLENEFRDKLNEREINPSLNSWERLDAMLTEVEEKKPKRNSNWLFIAASIMGFLFIGTMFFSQTDEITDISRTNIVLENKETGKPLENSILKKEPTITPLQIKSQSLVAVSKSEKTKSISKDSKTTNVENPELLPNSKPIVEQETEKSNPSNQDYTEVDKLLASVKLSSKNENPKSYVKVNPHDLLSEVNGELELSFREKVINTIDKNFRNVKVVLSSRNQTSKNK